MTGRAVVVGPGEAGRLALAPVPPAEPGRSEAIVRVAAFSLNRGEVRRALTMAPPGWRPGWDLAGIVERAAADGSGPRAGARVVGLLPEGAWADRVAVPAHALAELPATVTLDQAATLPVAGLTALLALAKGPALLGRRALVTGATGGVGDFAIQLARLGGAHVTALVRRADQAEGARALGAHEVIVGDEVTAGPYDLVVESVGGRTLATALASLAEGGTCVTLGVSAASEVTFDARQFFLTGRATLYGFILFRELGAEPAGAGLARLARLVADGRLVPHVRVTAPWTDVDAVARQLLQRRFAGKAVLAVQER